MPTRPLPNDSSFENLKKQAKALHKAVRASDAKALALVREFHPHATVVLAEFRLADAQLVVACSYGFRAWANLKQHG
jgi:hypothetical protein